MNKIIITSLVVVLSTIAFAQRRGNVRKGTDVPRQSATENKILLEQLPKTGMSSCLGAPRIDGPSQIGQCYMKPRRWIVCETKYKTFAKFIDQLTFTWHVLLESKTATENKGNKEGLAPYSYFSTTVNYFNIPNGSHAACVCLPPSYLELYGEPMLIYGDGEQTRAFSFIDDCLESFWNAAIKDRASKQIVNVGGEIGYTINEAAKALCEITGYDKVEYREARHEVKHATTTADKSKKILGYKQSTTLKDGLIQMWEWVKTQPKREQFKWENYEIDKGIYTYWK